MIDKRLIVPIFVGITILYGGILTLGDDTEVGAAMMIAGGILAAIPLWRAFRHFRNPPVTQTGSHQSRKRKIPHHLRVIRPEEEEERPTYH